MTDDWPSAGTLLATRYRLVALLETGGMAQIWRATDELLARPVAVKLPTGPQVAWREARMAAKLSHPGIAAVHDYREALRSDGTVAPFVVMELLGGETVALRLTRETFGWPEAARIGAAVADALAAAHASGVVHRDVKPGNVMLTPNGVKILDFGISAAAGEPDDDDTGATFGTPAYVAPERLDGMPAEPATDVYGLGVLLFEMVTGQPPYPVETWEELEKARESGPTTLPTYLPAPFRAVVERCLAEDPADRPGADDIRFELTALWLAEKPSPPAEADPEADPGIDAEVDSGESWSGPLAVWAPDAAPRPTRGPSGPGRGSDRPTGRGPTSTSSHHAPTAGRPAPTTGRPASTAGSSSPTTGSSAPTSTAGRLAPTTGRAASADGRAAAARAGEPVAAGTRRPRVAEVWPAQPHGPLRSAGGAPPGYTPGSAAAPGAASGRVTAATAPMQAAPPKRRLALVVLGVLALLAAVGGIFAVVHRPREKNEATAPPPPVPATLFYTTSPALVAPTTEAAPTTTPPSRSPSPAPKLSFDDALGRLRDTVQQGGLRPDIATDLLNLIQPLNNPDDKDVEGRLDAIRRKVNQRAGEGSLTPTQATTLRARLTDLDRAAGV